MNGPSPQDSEPSAKRDPGERHTRLSRAWTELVAGALALVVILVFILQNLPSVELSFLVLLRAHDEVALVDEIEAINDWLTGPGARPQVRVPSLGGSPCYLGCVERSEAVSHLDVRRVAVRRPSPASRRRAGSQLR